MDQQALQELISLFLKINPQPSDQQFHSLAEAVGVDKEELESISYGMLSDAEDLLEGTSTHSGGNTSPFSRSDAQVYADDEDLDIQSLVDPEVRASIYRVNAAARLMADAEDVLDDPTIDPDELPLTDVALNDGDPTDDDLGQQEETMDDGYTEDSVGVGLSNNANDVLTDDGIPDLTL